jgi:hypothetical protein
MIKLIAHKNRHRKRKWLLVSSLLTVQKSRLCLISMCTICTIRNHVIIATSHQQLCFVLWCASAVSCALCSAVLCCAVLWSIILCCAVLCYAVLYVCVCALLALLVCPRRCFDMFETARHFHSSSNVNCVNSPPCSEQCHHQCIRC